MDELGQMLAMIEQMLQAADQMSMAASAGIDWTPPAF